MSFQGMLDLAATLSARHLPMKEPIVVRESPIHGKGMFATRVLRVGEIILRMESASFSAVERHPWNRRNRDVLPHFINHSCEANVAIAYSAIERAMVLVVARFIHAGEEITLDYTTVELSGMSAACHCGSATCRGTFPVNLEDSW